VKREGKVGGWVMGKVMGGQSGRSVKGGSWVMGSGRERVKGGGKSG
jgi:hypothetical protein